MRRALLAAGVLFGFAAAACAPKTVPAPVVSTPKYPEFIRPLVPSSFASSPVAESQQLGWAYLQSGDLKTAEREFTAALKASPAFFPAETSLGYVELARKDAKAALPHFDRVVEQQPKDVPALVGRGQALIALNRDADALVSFSTAVAIDPTLTELAFPQRGAGDRARARRRARGAARRSGAGLHRRDRRLAGQSIPLS
jgi:tetratricopeptide (TPR) repeat protein